MPSRGASSLRLGTRSSARCGDAAPPITRNHHVVQEAQADCRGALSNSLGCIQVREAGLNGTSWVIVCQPQCYGVVAQRQREHFPYRHHARGSAAGRNGEDAAYPMAPVEQNEQDLFGAGVPDAGIAKAARSADVRSGAPTWALIREARANAATSREALALPTPGVRANSSTSARARPPTPSQSAKSDPASVNTPAPGRPVPRWMATSSASDSARAPSAIRRSRGRSAGLDMDTWGH